MNEKIEIIKRALKNLGVKGKVKIELFYDNAIVYLNGSYFGTYNFNRRTFVD